jgi:hypothetical protein
MKVFFRKVIHLNIDRITDNFSIGIGQEILYINRFV